MFFLETAIQITSNRYANQSLLFGSDFVRVDSNSAFEMSAFFASWSQPAGPFEGILGLGRPEVKAGALEKMVACA